VSRNKSKSRPRHNRDDHRDIVEKKSQGVLGKLWLWYQKKRRVLQFSAIFGALLIVFYSLTAGTTYDRFLAWYLTDTARLSSKILNCFGLRTIASGLTLESNRFAFTIERGCDAIEPCWFFGTAVLAYPAGLMRKLLGVALGVVLLNLLNLIRICSLFLLGTYAPGYFFTIHIEIWPAGFIVLSLLLWVCWIAWTWRDVRAN
jgi:exosortase H (IPTLxxWG-CTERM-specific)